jgi:cytochrome b561
MIRQAPNPSAGRWGVAIRCLHWLTVTLLCIQFFVAFVLMGGGMRTITWLPTHLTLGFSLVAVTIARLVFRLIDRGEGMKRRRIARVLHATLYLVLLGVLSSGWLSFRPTPFSPSAQVFGFIPVRTLLLPGDFPWGSLHRALVWAFIALAGVHIGAVVIHVFLFRDDVLRRMWLWR